MALDYTRIRSLLTSAETGATKVPIILTAGRAVVVKEDSYREFQASVGDYLNAKDALGKATVAEKAGNAYKNALKKLGKVGDDLRTLGKNLAQSAADSTVNYASCVDEGKRHLGFIPLPAPSAASVRKSLEYGRKTVAETSKYVADVERSLDDAKLEDKTDKTYFKNLQTRLSNTKDTMEATEQRVTAKLVDKEWAKVARRVSKLSGH